MRHRPSGIVMLYADAKGCVLGSRFSVIVTVRFSPISAPLLPACPCLRPLLEHVVQCAMTSSSAGVYDSEETRVSPAAGGEAAKVSSVVSSSCHDVTILALLYAMQSDLIVSEYCTKLLPKFCCFSSSFRDVSSFWLVSSFLF